MTSYQLLVNAGPTSRGATDAELLLAHGVTQLDAFVATHYDAYHYGGLPKVAESGIEPAAATEGIRNPIHRKG